MSSKKNPCIKKLKLRVLKITETPNAAATEPVIVKLAKGGQVGTVTNLSGEVIPIFQGEMTYQRPGKEKVVPVDMVEADFISDEGKAADLGNIVLKVNLTEGNTFVTPLVTTIPSVETSVPTHCVSIEGSGDSQITVTFMEPAQGEFVAYPALYFHTKEGIIDPSLIVRRKPD